MAQATLKGKVKWFKYLDEPRENKYKPYLDKDRKPIKSDQTGLPKLMRDWSTMLSVDSTSKLLMKQYKVRKQVKFDEELGDFINLDLAETDKKGDKFNPRAEVVDTDGNPWPKDKWIGHGTEVEVIVDVNKYDFKDHTGSQITGASLVPRKFIIVNHVPYVKPGNDTPAKRVDNVNWSDNE